MRHFNTFEKGAPFPGTCIVTGDNRNLISLDVQLPDYGAVMINQRTAEDLAHFMGWAPKHPLQQEIEHLRMHIKELEAQLDRVPKETEELVDGIRNSVASFVLRVSSGGDDASSTPNEDDKPATKKSNRARKTEDSNA
jgi:hypothetical protein